MLRRWIHILKVAFTYVGTVVGAGFATGQEILQFFTRYGSIALLTIGVSGLLFIWIGTRTMLLAHQLQAVSYEQLNKHLFGERFGQWFSLFSLMMLFGIATVMLAGAGSVLEEHSPLSFQAGLLVTLAIAYVIIARGLDAIVAVNSIVAPTMLVFSGLIIYATMQSPHADNWLYLSTDLPVWRIWFAPLIYCAYNLATAQAVLVPLGAATADRKTIVMGGVVGGILIMAMMSAGHIALAAQMPGITQYEIPMSQLIAPLGTTIQLLFVVVIFGEIFTTFLADVYGLALQLRERTGWAFKPILLLILLGTYGISQIGFSTLLATLYPLFGMLSMLWFVRIIGKRPQMGC